MSPKRKYRDESLRLQHWDYGSNGSYFVTICTKYRIHHLGEIENDILELSKIGEIATENWLMIPQKFPYIKLGAFVIMPNHVHGILTINKKGAQSSESSMDLSNELSSGDAINRVPTAYTKDNPSTAYIKDNPSNALTKDNPTELSKGHHPELDSPSIENFDPHQTLPSKMVGGVTGNMNPMLHNNLSRVIRWYKGRTTYESRKILTEFAWQSRFYDHIIRNNFSHRNITNYIKSNVKNWGKDKLI